MDDASAHVSIGNDDHVLIGYDYERGGTTLYPFEDVYGCGSNSDPTAFCIHTTSTKEKNPVVEFIKKIETVEDYSEFEEHVTNMYGYNRGSGSTFSYSPGKDTAITYILSSTIFSARRSIRTQAIPGMKLNEDARKLLEKDPDEFAQTYGHFFVSARSFGCSYNRMIQLVPTALGVQNQNLSDLFDTISEDVFHDKDLSALFHDKVALAFGEGWLENSIILNSRTTCLESHDTVMNALPEDTGAHYNSWKQQVIESGVAPSIRKDIRQLCEVNEVRSILEQYSDTGSKDKFCNTALIDDIQALAITRDWARGQFAANSALHFGQFPCVITNDRLKQMADNIEEDQHSNTLAIQQSKVNDISVRSNNILNLFSDFKSETSSCFEGVADSSDKVDPAQPDNSSPDYTSPDRSSPSSNSEQDIPSSATTMNHVRMDTLSVDSLCFFLFIGGVLRRWLI